MLYYDAITTDRYQNDIVGNIIPQRDSPAPGTCKLCS